MGKLTEERMAGHIPELLLRTATSLPADVRKAISDAASAEEKDSAAQATLRLLLENVDLAKGCSSPVCQDTGSIIMYVDYNPAAWSQKALTSALHKAAAEATAKSYLRPNAVDPLTGKNSGNNIGEGAPYVHFEEWDRKEMRFRLLLKGGGSENVSRQYSLPDSRLGAGRDIEGIRRCVIDAVFQAQGEGCAPGIIGVGIGGPDRAASMLLAKEQLFRRLDDVNPREELAELEGRLFRELNTLSIGPMGFGGATTVLGVRMGAQHRHPASFFVSIAYLCWAARRGSMTVSPEAGVSYD